MNTWFASQEAIMMLKQLKDLRSLTFNPAVSDSASHKKRLQSPGGPRRSVIQLEEPVIQNTGKETTPIPPSEGGARPQAGRSLVRRQSRRRGWSAAGPVPGAREPRPGTTTYPWGAARRAVPATQPDPPR